MGGGASLKAGGSNLCCSAPAAAVLWKRPAGLCLHLLPAASPWTCKAIALTIMSGPRLQGRHRLNCAGPVWILHGHPRHCCGFPGGFAWCRVAEV